MPFNVPLADPTLAGARSGQIAGVPASASGVVSAIRDASARSGMPFNVMLASAQMESGLNPNAQAGTSSATGLFQFIDQTWLDTVRQYGAQHGLATDATSIVRRDGRLTVDDPTAKQRILDLRKDPAVASAMEGAGHPMAANLLSGGRWYYEGSQPAVQLTASEFSVKTTLGPELLKTANGAASKALGRPVKLKVSSGGTPNAAPNGKPARPTGSSTSRVAEDPIVKKMQETFGAEIRTVIDYQNKK